MLLSRAQEIQKTINTYKEKNSSAKLDPKQKQRLFKLMDVSFPKIFPEEDNGSYNDSKFKSSLEKFKRGIRIIDEIPQENENMEDEDLNNSSDDPIWGSNDNQNNQIEDDNEKQDEGYSNDNWNETWGNTI